MKLLMGQPAQNVEALVLTAGGAVKVAVTVEVGSTCRKVQAFDISCITLARSGFVGAAEDEDEVLVSLAIRISVKTCSARASLAAAFAARGASVGRVLLMISVVVVMTLVVIVVVVVVNPVENRVLRAGLAPRTCPSEDDLRRSRSVVFRDGCWGQWSDQLVADFFSVLLASLREDAPCCSALPQRFILSLPKQASK